MVLLLAKGDNRFTGTIQLLAKMQDKSFNPVDVGELWQMLSPIAHKENNTMPIISMFYGIIIRLYLIDNQHHNLPHIHAKYAEFEASIGLGR